MQYWSIRRAVWSFILLAGITVGPGTSSGQIVVTNGLTHQWETTKGSALEGVIRIRNSTAEAQQVRIYKRDYRFFADGRNLYEEPGSHERSNASWVQISPVQLTVQPRGTAQLNVTIRIPSDSSIAGTYWSMVMVEGVAPSAADAQEQQVGVQTRVRYGVQLITSIERTGSVDVAFENTDLLHSEEGGNVLQLDLVNRGTRLARPEVWVELYDSEGKRMGRFSGKRRRLYPGTSVRQKIELGVEEKGTYTVLVFADAGSDNVFGTRYTLQM